MGEGLDDTGTKGPLSLRVTRDTRHRAEAWVEKYQNIFGRADVLRMIFEMGLRRAEKNGGLEVLPPEQPEPSRRRLKVAPSEER